MTYTAGSTILATDYNGFVANTVGANINAVWNTTYGQPAITTAAVGANVTALNWSNLTTTLSKMAAHSNTTVTAHGTINSGDTITILTNLNTDITNCYNNRANAASVGSQYTGWTGTASQTTATGAGSAAWLLTFTDTVTFANASAANAFFGAGGLVKIQFNKSSTGTDADPDWNDFISNVCANSGVYFCGANSANIAGVAYTGTTKFGGSGTPTTLATTTNWTNLTTSPATIYKQFYSGAAYSSNYVQVTANTNANADVLTLTTTWLDAGDPNAGANTAISGGTATTGITFGTAPATVVTYYPPETTNLTNVWGTPTVVSSVANSAPGYTGTYLVVGGGGGGGGGTGGSGGGGAGGLLTGTLTVVTGTTYSATVGAGGAANTSGANSVLGALTAVGGGAGGTGQGGVGKNGGSGGGGGGQIGSTTAGGSGVYGQGYFGGVSFLAANYGAGGGGGAGATGGDGGNGIPGTTSGGGGAGVSSSITGAAVTYAGGGGGGSTNSGATAGAGGAGGGGNGGTVGGTAGTDGLGGGGGGCNSGTAGKGGNGVVILSVPTASYSGTTTGSPTITTSGSNTIIKWTTGSGSYLC